ncbi:unnamed protein product [Haemonchus placei]|uniref:PAP-associated domain-containing protein n=1 Tax=Haemonchus placei TaxID=6290 RepID=A0A0N4VXF2_HAEPC|nr:unnamed protein product [Haemonchus placei]
MNTKSSKHFPFEKCSSVSRFTVFLFEGCSVNERNYLDWTSNNKMTTAELIVRFVDYYSTFDASQNAIYIEKGLAARRSKQVSGDIHLLLLDPYSRTTVCRSGIAAKAFADSMQYLRRKMVHGQFLDSFPTFPEATLFKAQTKWVSWLVITIVARPLMKLAKIRSMCQ